MLTVCNIFVVLNQIWRWELSQKYLLNYITAFLRYFCKYVIYSPPKNSLFMYPLFQCAFSGFQSNLHCDKTEMLACPKIIKQRPYWIWLLTWPAFCQILCGNWSPLCASLKIYHFIHTKGKEFVTQPVHSHYHMIPEFQKHLGKGVSRAGIWWRRERRHYEAMGIILHLKFVFVYKVVF